MKFDDVDLNTDKNAPKIDLDFGLPAAGTATGDKKSGGSSFGFGSGWGGGWNSNSWGFGGTEDKTADTKVDDSWNFGTSKKDKKKSNGFDFNFDNLGGEADDLGLGTKKDEPAEEDPW